MSTDQEMLRKAADYILTLRDPQSGGFAFAKSNQPTLMATAYAIHALEFTKGLRRLSAAHRDAVVQFLTRCCRPDGTFCDLLFDASQIATTQHDESYFIHEATCFAQNALDALGAPPPLKRAFPQTLLTPSGLKKEFDSYDWSDPHLNSNRVMFWMGQFAHEVDRHGRTELLPLLDAGLDWMDAHQSPETGLWSGPVSVSLSAAMAATFHFTFFYAFRRRPLLHLERIIDSCLELQKPDGLFSRNNCVGQTCLDYDALDLLAKATLVTEYRGRDIQAAFHAARGALLGLVNTDGGFANVKHRRIAGQCLPPPGLYHTGLKICSCDNQESNVFSTWFRLLALALCDQFQWVDKKNNAFGFRRLPWLGCHDVAAIRRSYAKEQHAATHTDREPQPCASVQSRQLKAAESTPEIISRELNMSLKGVSIIIISTTQSSNRMDQFLSSFFAVNTHTPVEVIIPIEVAGPGNRRDIVLKYTTKAFVRPVMYTGNQPVSAVANLCASKARYNFLFFVNDQSQNYKENILEKTLRALDVRGIGAVSVDNTNENKLYLKNIQNKEFNKHRLSAIGVDLWMVCSKKDFQALSGFGNTNSDTGIILENDRTNDASKTLTVPQKPKISIIIPVYDSEPYLRKCIDSVVNQTLNDIEIIIVNDCTPDNSEEIILEYKAKDPRIVYIKHERNLGLGGVRNTGIEAAKGKYQWHIDSDDFIDLNACNFLWGLIQSHKDHNLDILCFSAFNYKIKNNFSVPILDNALFRDREVVSKVQSGTDIFKKIYEVRGGFPCAMWLNLFRSNFVKRLHKDGVKLRHNCAHQDTDFVPIVFNKAETVLCTHYTPYYRLIHSGAVTSKKTTLKGLKDKFSVSLYLFKYIVENARDDYALIKFAEKDYKYYLKLYCQNLNLDSEQTILPIINVIDNCRAKLRDKHDLCKPKLSVIIPVYNTEKDLPRCLDSVVNQTLYDIEIIVVNDCSPDNSEEVILNYKQNDHRIVYLKHDINHRQGGARNTGMKQANGDYIGFVDSDDWIELNMYENMFFETINSDSDMTICSISAINEKGQKRKIGKNLKQLTLNEHYEFFNDLSNTVSVCNRIYKRDLLIKNKIKFPISVRAEDQVFILEVAYLSKKILTIPESYYIYAYRSTSDVNSRKLSFSSENQKVLKKVIYDFNQITHFLIELSNKHPKMKTLEAYKHRLIRWIIYSSLQELLVKIIFQYKNNKHKAFLFNYWRDNFINRSPFGKSTFKSTIFKNYEYTKIVVNDIFDYLFNISLNLKKNNTPSFVLSEFITLFKNSENFLNVDQTSKIKKWLKPYEDAYRSVKKVNELIYNQRVTITRLSPFFDHHFFGYFDVKAMNNRQEHLSLQVDFVDRLPSEKDKAKICLIKPTGEIHVLDETYAWNFQQGAFQQFLPNSDDQIIYNIFDLQDKQYKSVLLNIKTNKKRILPFPVANISPKGDQALSINFSRLFDYRPGYGYCNITDKYKDGVKPKNDGVFLIDLNTGHYDLIISYDRLWKEYAEGTKNENDKLIVNHINFNTDGTKFLMLLRFFSKTAPWPTLTLVSDIEGKNIKKIFGFGSHYHWKDPDNLVISGANIHDKSEMKSMTAYEISSVTGKYKAIDQDFFVGDGHCSYSPDRQYLLYDSYTTKQFPYKKLQIYDIEEKKGITLCYLFSDSDLYKNNGDCRCDFHPRWSTDGKFVTFDSIHEGFRGVYKILVNQAVEEIDSYQENQLSEQEIKININPTIINPKKVQFMRNNGIFIGGTGKCGTSTIGRISEGSDRLKAVASNLERLKSAEIILR